MARTWRTLASAAVVLLPAAPSHAATAPETAARALKSDPVYVHPDAAGRLDVQERGRIRIAIVGAAIGRIKVAVVPEQVAARAGGVQGFADAVDRELGLRGTLIVVAGSSYWALTSYPRSDRAAAALRSAVNERPNDPLADELVLGVRRIGRVDPGRAGDLQQGEPGNPVSIPEADDFLDDIGDAFRLGVLIVAAAIALPFVIGALFLLGRARRTRAREGEIRRAREESADTELVELGDEIRSLDLDTSMPNANRGALAEYEQAIASYDQANDLLLGDPSEYEVEQARAAIAAGRRHIAAARERLG